MTDNTNKPEALISNTNTPNNLPDDPDMQNPNAYTILPINIPNPKRAARQG